MTLPIEIFRFDALKKLAAERLGEITPAEEEVLRRSASTEDKRPPASDDHSDVRAAFLRWLATDKEAEAHIDPLGIRVANDTITSALNLNFCKLPFPLVFWFCTLQDQLSLFSAELPALYLFECKTEKGISAAFLTTQRTVFLQKLKTNGQLNFTGAQIGGDLHCSGATLTVEGKALSADRANIAGSVFLREGFTSSGEIRLLGAQIGGDLDCSKATLAAKGSALNADGARIGGYVQLRREFSCSGTMNFLGAQIGGDLICSHATIRNLTCENVLLAGDLIWTAIREPEESYLNLFGASIKMLRDDTPSWPARGNLVVKGLEYKDLIHHESATQEHLRLRRGPPQRPLDAGERVRWLNLQDDEDRLDPHAWMWLAKLFKEKGQDHHARWVLLNYRLKRATAGNWLLWLGRVALALLSWEPLLVLLPFLFILCWGSQIYQRAWNEQSIRPTASDAYTAHPAVPASARADEYSRAYPAFNPWIYVLENELPLAKFGMDDKWAPDPNLIAKGKSGAYWSLAGFRWFLILAGWAQGILLTLGVNRRFRD